MIRFGFSYYLKLLALNPKPRKTELRKRMLPSDGGGYDYHKRMRLLVKRFILEPGPRDISKRHHIMSGLKQIGPESERNSAASALKKISEWVPDEESSFFKIDGATYESPNGGFQVKFTPEFGMVKDGGSYAIHVWNTQKPRLTERSVQAALLLFNKTLPKGILPSVLCLQTSRFFTLKTSVENLEIANLFANDIETTMADIEKGPADDRPRDDDKPIAPPPV